MRKKAETPETFDSILESEKQSTPTPETNNLHTAIVSVMKAVKNIDKSMTVGSGSNSYKGVADKDVKYIIGQAMAENNLTCVPINVVPDTKIDRWDTTDYNGKPTTKQSVFVSVTCTYRITHAISGESIDIVGYGHGVDPQDKAAGKAMTYALKNALLYSFLVPTGHIEDTDATHSGNIDVPTQQKAVQQGPKVLDDKQFIQAVGAINAGKYTVKYFLDNYQLTTEQINVLNELNA